MTPFQYSTDQIESRLAFNDVIAGLWLTEQTNPAAIRRIRQLNPNAVILPYVMSGAQRPEQAAARRAASSAIAAETPAQRFRRVEPSFGVRGKGIAIRGQLQ
jgi:hypothetical protein